jgi:hypothetical protein
MSARRSPCILLVQQPNDDVGMYVEFFSAHRFTIIAVSTVGAALGAAGDADIVSLRSTSTARTPASI